MPVFLILLTFAQTFKHSGNPPEERGSQSWSRGVVMLLLRAFTQFETHPNHVNERIKRDEISTRHVP